MVKQSKAEQRKQKLTYWTPYIDSWREMDISMAEYCRRHELSYSQMCYWKKQILEIETVLDFSPKKFLKDQIKDQLRRLTKGNPTFTLTILYLILSASGLLYSYLFFQEFKINIFDFIEVKDFFIAFFKNWSIVYITFFIASIIFFLFFFDFLLKKIVPDEPTLTYIVRLTWVAYFIIAAYLFYNDTQNAAYKIKEESQVFYNVLLWPKESELNASNIKTAMLPPRMLLIGSTEKHHFFYDRKSLKVYIIPISSVQSIEVETEEARTTSLIREYKDHRGDKRH